MDRGGGQKIGKEVVVGVQNNGKGRKLGTTKMRIPLAEWKKIAARKVVTRSRRRPHNEHKKMVKGMLAVLGQPARRTLGPSGKGGNSDDRKDSVFVVDS